MLLTYLSDLTIRVSLSDGPRDYPSPSLPPQCTTSEAATSQQSLKYGSSGTDDGKKILTAYRNMQGPPCKLTVPRKRASTPARIPFSVYGVCPYVRSLYAALPGALCARQRTKKLGEMVLASARTARRILLSSCDGRGVKAAMTWCSGKAAIAKCRLSPRCMFLLRQRRTAPQRTVRGQAQLSEVR